MRLPRDCSGKELAKLLAREFGYVEERQRGSHLRMKTEEYGPHAVTIPLKSNVRIGTLASILAEVAHHFQITKEEVADRIFR